MTSPESPPLDRTALWAWHGQHNGQLVDFGGWEMPLRYGSIVAEHHATRQQAGLFDIGHMARFRFTGPDTVRFLDHVYTNQVATLKPGQVRYGVVLNDNGGCKDDVLVYRLPDFHLMVVNASNRKKVWDWFTVQRAAGSFDVEMVDATFEWAMIAIQGPKALDIVRPWVTADPGELKYYFATETKLRTVATSYALVSRTGYTGEDGVELIVPVDQAVPVWQALVQGGAQPVGLAARDTLRLEAGMCLYGHELDEDVDPLQAGLGWAVKADRKDFVGKPSLLARPQDRPIRVGIELEGKRAPREGFVVEKEGEPVGRVTSGSFTPTLQKAIGMAYVEPGSAAEGTRLGVRIRDAVAPAKVVPLPFYRRKS